MPQPGGEAVTVRATTLPPPPLPVGGVVEAATSPEPNARVGGVLMKSQVVEVGEGRVRKGVRAVKAAATLGEVHPWARTSAEKTKEKLFAGVPGGRSGTTGEVQRGRPWVFEAEAVHSSIHPPEGACPWSKVQGRGTGGMAAAKAPFTLVVE
jgi:hypothetical protein